jgi:sterol desaturase/sphingolipid hydroxylase (fatty acid hydroxylase superfamily)
MRGLGRALLGALHPLVILAEVAVLAAVWQWGAGFWRAPGALTVATAGFLVGRRMLVFAVYYGGFALLVRALPKRRLPPQLHPDPQPQVAGEVRRSMMSWAIAAGYELLLALAVSTGALRLSSAPWWSLQGIAVAVLLVVWADLHFYLVHRLLHVRWLYRTVHRVHHLSIAPNPWSSLSFHPIEALLYFSAVLGVWLLPVTAFHVVFVILAVDLTPAYGHLGYGRPDSGAAFHFLHHRRNRVNYGASALWDHVFGTRA